MKKLFLVLTTLLFLFALVTNLYAQQQLPARHKVAVFVPLYLDTAFDALDEYGFGKTFPKFLNPGLEFYEGVQLAVDSLNKTGIALDVMVYDTRSKKSSILQVSQKPEFQNTELIIGHVAYNEVKVLAEIAKNKNIPFINTNIPNDMGITNNPSFVLLNSTLLTHCQAIYKFLQKSYASSPIVLFTRKGVQEDVLKGYFAQIEKSTPTFPLKIRVVTLKNNFTPQDMLPYFDSTRVTMCIAASLDETFAKDIARHLAYLNKTYPVHLFGMPTWDMIRDFEKRDYRDLEIFYSTPFYNAKTDRISISITNHFKQNLFSRPTDMVFRGYECMMRFGKLLADYGPNLGSSIGEKKYKVFTDFDIQPVFTNQQSPRLDYFENRKLYFVKMIDGNVRAVY
jgi:hypothetical protein